MGFCNLRLSSLSARGDKRTTPQQPNVSKVLSHLAKYCLDQDDTVVHCVFAPMLLVSRSWLTSRGCMWSWEDHDRFEGALPIPESLLEEQLSESMIGATGCRCR